MNKKLLSLLIICLLMSLDGVSIGYLENPSYSFNNQLENHIRAVTSYNNSTSLLNNPNQLITEKLLNNYTSSSSTNQSLMNPIIDTSDMNKTVSYNATELEQIVSNFLNKEYTMNDALVNARGKSIEYIETYTNESHTIINKTIVLLDTLPVSLEDAINKALPSDIIESYQIVKQQQVTDYNKQFIPLEMGNNLGYLINQRSINLTIDINAFQEAIEFVLNDSISLITVKYLPKNGFNKNNPIIAKLLYNTKEKYILFDSFASNIFKPRLDYRNIILIYSHSLRNQISVYISDEGNYGEQFLAWFITLTHYTASFSGTITIDPNGFIYQPYPGVISIKNNATVTITGTASKNVWTHSTLDYWYIYIIPIVGIVFAVWVDARIDDTLTKSLYSQISFSVSCTNNDYAGSISPIVVSWSSGAGYSSQNYTRTFKIYRGSGTGLIGAATFTLTIVG